MFKFSGIFDLKPGVDPEETWQHWREKHVLYAKEYLLPGARKYNINRRCHAFGDTDIWGISEFWFDDVETAMTAVGRLQKAPPDDFYMQRIKPAIRVLLKEDIIELPATADGGRFKLVAMCSLRAGVDGNGAYEMWRGPHASWLRDKVLTGATRFTINRVVHDFRGGDVFGYAMAWFGDKASAVEAGERLLAAPPDEFLKSYVTPPNAVVVEEEKVDL